jgi:hemerythrin superfamily protein
MDVVSLITVDHRNVEKLFDDYRATGPRDTARKRIVREITAELVRHGRAEEEIVYPEAQNLVELPVVNAALVAHGEITNCLADLESLDWRSPEYERTVVNLMKTVRRHVADEERDILPALRRGMTATALAELGALLAKAQDRSPPRPPKTAKSPKLLLRDGAKAAIKTARKAIDVTARAIAPSTSKPKSRGSSQRKRAGIGKRRTRKTAARSRARRRAH